ncbi:piezo-type mechanosensitive ion channel component isoform X6 [Lucilia cuprina]|uniref:piezo-type mechanosensitive ion channel component isoform X6 n=1 Tax=Lucilia cuprina TaxID=7375 RepID=UPI001F06C0AB|nr:piezo-type mechanosensitive ion channel component isoform X6 [Lucilia cuprina]
MAFSYACLTLQRVVLPIILVLAALYRPVGISFVYLLMFFISPFVPVATKKNFKTSVTPYFIILIALSTILLLCHIGLQVSILALDIGDSFGTCTVIERLLRHVGFIGFKHLKVLAIIEWLIPEVVVFITSLVVYLVTKKISQKVELLVENGNVDAADIEETLEASGSATAGGELTAVKINTDLGRKTQEDNDKPNFDGLIKISPLFCLATLFFSAVLRPSVPGGFYFLIFLLSGSYWATFQTLQRKFAILLRLVMVVIVAHTICIVAYQTPWMQDHLDKTSLTARLIGLEPLITSTCANDIRIIVYDTQFKADSFLNPIVLFFTYYALALTTKNLIKARIIAKPATAFGHEVDNSSTHKIQRQISLITQTSRSSKKDGSRSKSQRLNVTLRREQQRPQIITEPTETTPLMRSATRKTTTTTTDNNSGITPQQQQTNNDNIPLSSMDANQSGDVEYKSGICDQIWYGITGIGGFIYQNSYIFTNVLMMAWSIVYHSWLTFVLLLWANVLWMIPNQRKAMMRSSPFIVIYGELLLIAQYIYGMDLNNDELPSKVDISGINLKQIGFERPQENGMQPCIPLIVKTSFLLMFWVTLRQFFKEKTDKRRDSTLADIFAPLQLSVGHSIGDQGQVGGKKTSKFLKKMGIVIKNLLVRLWIWLLVLVIFLCAMTGEKMTGFRICYMALFLFFLLVFQSSSKAWVKLMYGFWLFLIFYAMSILILIYTYQFDKFDKYWEQYLNISTTLQTDIGLERYKTKDLFLHLVSPTIIVILTVIQVHYFHKRFIASMNQPTEVVERDSEERVRHKSRTTSRVAESEGLEFVESAGNLIRLFLKRCRHKTEVFFKHFKGVIWRLLELHWIKVVYITAFVCAVSEVSLLHVPFVALCVVGVVSNVRMNFFFSRLISLVVTIIVLSKMIYQIAYLNHAKYDYKCPSGDVDGQYKGNNAEWFGLYKASPEFGLMGLLKRYIIYMVIATLHAVIALRQYQMRRLKGIQNDPLPKVAFPGIGREDAEKKLEGMIKYLLNYGFYKFGYETCLVALVSTITYRQDIVAVAYSVWLILLLLFKRKKNAHIWGVLQVFILSSILVQYVLLVELPPSMCVEYVWVNTKYSEALQRWAMLPGDLHYDHTKKLIFDFVLLLLVNRQKRVFTLENIADYPGGSNKSVIKDIANLGKVEFENPTHDFLSHIRNYLDIFKHAVLCGFYWVTLAVVFLAGTNISDFLAIGYLIGAFMFLWEGSDFYLRPIRSITTRWKWLLAYNVANIVIKTSLQMVGCLFMDTLQMKCCWVVHLLGISCSSKDIMSDLAGDPANECPAITVQSVLLWDAICFAFLIFQLRIFKSHYFCHIITDTRANNILASRGAEIIESLRQKQIEKRQDYEEEVLHKIKRKMEKIRATQQKMLRPLEKPTHFDEHGNPVYGSRPHKRKEIKLHPQAVRAGDYYMFEDVDDKFELEVITDSEGLFDTDNENITDSEIKMSRRKTLYDESQKPKNIKDGQTDMGPSTSKAGEIPSRAQTSEAKQKTEVDSGDTGEDSDADFQANPIIRLMEAFLVSLTIRLNRFSRNYRYVNKILAEEKKALKESNNMCNMFKGRFSAKNAASLFNIMKRNIASTEIAFDDEDFTARDHNIIVEVLISAWYAILSNTDLICYIVVFINQVVNASLISLPLPLMVFLWGTLSLPRPTKTFWVTLIAYTQAIVLIKCIFQFKLIWVNYHYNLPNNPLGIEKLFGVEMSSDYATYDLLLLLVLFFHRFILKSHGLWKIDNKPIDKYSEDDYDSKSTLNDTNGDEDENSERRNSGGSERNSEQRLTVSPNDLVKRVENLQRNKYLSGLTKFFHNLVHKARLPTDVYALMFLCDFINFFVLLFGFTAFSSKQADGGVKTYLAENKVPIPFLIMLLVQFVLIVIDRALYLRKALVYKIIFHFISVVGIHVWMFFIVPAVTERSFYASAPPIIFYIIKCFYLLLSSYQIKCGYPNRILGNFLTKSFSMINMISFKIYMLIPFLYELRTILDWLCTDTTMTLFDWLKMEDIFANIYSIKCLRQMETDFPAVRAQKKATFMKLLMGGSAILLIVFALWGPLTLFALSGAVGQSNVPTEVKVSIRIGSYDPIYVASTRESSFVFDDSMFSAMKNAYIKDKEALSFLLNYDASDVAAIKLKRNSPSMWNIAPPDKARLLSELESNVTLVVRLSYELTRTPPVKNQVGTVGSEITWEMTGDYADRKNLENMIRTGNENDTDATIPNIVPKFIKVLNSGDPTYISALVPKVNNTKYSDFTNMSISMNSAGNSSFWWEITDYCGGDDAVSTLLKKLPLYDCSSGIVFYTFNDKKFPSTWTFLTGGGIIGLYTTFVLLASRFLKNFLGGQTRRIMHEDLPNVDRVLQLCLDIYLVREALEFMLEEDLFAKLIFLYRSPETMIKWTRPREEIADDETDSDSVRSRMSGRRNDHPQPANVQ